jgi:hypothetical protein
LDDEIITGAVCVRSVLPEAGNRADHQPRVQRPQRCGIEPVLHQPADLVILDHHIGAGDERAHLSLALWRGDIHRQ